MISPSLHVSFLDLSIDVGRRATAIIACPWMNILMFSSLEICSVSFVAEILDNNLLQISLRKNKYIEFHSLSD